MLGIMNGGLQLFQFLRQFVFADRTLRDGQALAAGAKEGGTTSDSRGRGCADICSWSFAGIATAV